jgi:hypothetical protein
MSRIAVAEPRHAFSLCHFFYTCLCRAMQGMIGFIATLTLFHTKECSGRAATCVFPFVTFFYTCLCRAMQGMIGFIATLTLFIPRSAVAEPRHAFSLCHFFLYLPVQSNARHDWLHSHAHTFSCQGVQWQSRKMRFPPINPYTTCLCRAMQGMVGFFIATLTHFSMPRIAVAEP